MRETRAQSRMCTRANHGRGAAATVCAGWECWRWYGGGSVGALAAWSLGSLSPSLVFHFASFLSFSVSLFLPLPLSILFSLFSPSFVSVPPNTPPFFFLPLAHLICVCSLCPGFSIHLSLSLSFSLQKTPAGSLLLFPRGPPNSVSVAVTDAEPGTRFLTSPLPSCPLLLLETPRLYF